MVITHRSQSKINTHIQIQVFFLHEDHPGEMFPSLKVAIGFSSSESSLFLGDGDESVGFDSEGA